MAVSGSSIKSPLLKFHHVSIPFLLIKSKQPLRLNRRHSHLSVAESDRTMTDDGKSSNTESIPAAEESVPTPAEAPSSPDAQSVQKKTPLTARERLRAARVLSRSDSKPVRSEIGRSVMDALRESEKGKKGLPVAPTNMLDDSKRGMPKQGLTFSFPGGFDLFLIAFSFVFISSVMFATTYLVWKVGAIHYNEF
ncbi:Myotubularin-related protein 4 [Bienertia sinuspersici]